MLILFVFCAADLFLAFDENNDNQIDFKELVCGISACCRGPYSERHKCKLSVLLVIVVFSSCVQLLIIINSLL